MNRRQFLMGAGATLALPLIPSGLIPEPVTERVEQFLFVTARHQDADLIHKSMGRPRNVRVVGAGGQVMGYRADVIIMDEAWDRDHGSSTVTQRNDDWYNMCVRTRLVPDGEIIQSRTSIKEFDFDTKCGIAMEFRSDDEVRRNAVRHWKSKNSLTYQETVMTKAMLLEWYIRNRKPRYV